MVDDKTKATKAAEAEIEAEAKIAATAEAKAKAAAAQAIVEEKEAKALAVEMRSTLLRVIVHHLDMEGAAKDSPIPVNDLGDHAHGKAICFPGKETILSAVQVNILKDAIEPIMVSVPEGSGIYAEANPLRAAEAQFPLFVASRDRATGLIKLTRHKERFSVNVLGPYKKEEAKKE